MYKRPYEGKNNQDETDLPSHDVWVVQRLIDGHIAINSHEDVWINISMLPNKCSTNIK
jgi:hypothetical protein